MSSFLGVDLALNAFVRPKRGVAVLVIGVLIVAIDARLPHAGAAGIKGGVRKSSVYGNYQYNYDQNGYGSVRSTPSVKGQIDTEEKAQAKAVRFNSWKEIEDATATIRKEMTKRYQTEF